MSSLNLLSSYINKFTSRSKQMLSNKKFISIYICPKTQYLFKDGYVGICAINKLDFNQSPQHFGVEHYTNCVMQFMPVWQRTHFHGSIVIGNKPPYKCFSSRGFNIN